MSNTDTSAINDLLPTIIGESKMFFNKTGVSKALVDNYVMIGGTLQIPKWDDTISVYAMTEGVPMGTSQAITTSNATITAVKYGANTIVTDEAIKRARAVGNYDMVAKAGQILGLKAANKVNATVAGLFSGFSSGAGTIGSTETTLEAVMVGYSTVKAKGPLSEPFVILHPWHMHHLKANLAYPAATYPASIPDASLPNWMPPSETINGVQFYIDNQLTETGGGAYGAVLTKESIGLGFEWAPDSQVEVVRIPQTGYEVSFSMSFGVIEVFDAGGYYIANKASA